MSVSLAAYKVATNETSSSSKFDNLVQAVEDSLNAIGDTTKMAWKSGLIFDPSQIKQNAAASGQALAWNGSIWAPATVGGGAVVYKKTTQKDVVNTTTKTDLFNAEITIGAGVMTSSGRMLITAGGDYLNNSGSSRTATLELKLGTTVLWAAAGNAIAVSATRRAWHLHAWVQAQAATNAQRGGGIMWFSSTTAATTGTGSHDSVSDQILGVFETVASTEDMTASKALTFSVTHAAANASLSMRLDYARVEVL